MCSIITSPSPPSVNFGCDCSRAIRSKRFLQMNLLHAFCMSISFFFGRGKTFARWMNLGTINLLKNCALCRTVSLRFEAPHKLRLTLVCIWLKFIAIVSLTVGQKTIPRTFTFGEEVNYSGSHCFLSFQILRPSNLVFRRLIRALVDNRKPSQSETHELRLQHRSQTTVLARKLS